MHSCGGWVKNVNIFTSWRMKKIVYYERKFYLRSRISCGFLASFSTAASLCPFNITRLRRWMLAGECGVIALKYFINSEYFIMFSCVELHFLLVREQTSALFLELSTLFMVLDPTPFPRITQPMQIIYNNKNEGSVWSDSGNKNRSGLCRVRTAWMEVCEHLFCKWSLMLVEPEGLKDKMSEMPRRSLELNFQYTW